MSKSIQTQLLEAVVGEVSTVHQYLLESSASSDATLNKELVQAAIEESKHALAILQYLGFEVLEYPQLSDANQVRQFNSLLEAVAIEQYSSLLEIYPDISNLVEPILSDEQGHEEEFK